MVSVTIDSTLVITEDRTRIERRPYRRYCYLLLLSRHAKGMSETTKATKRFSVRSVSHIHLPQMYGSFRDAYLHEYIIRTVGII